MNITALRDPAKIYTFSEKTQMKQVYLGICSTYY